MRRAELFRTDISAALAAGCGIDLADLARRCSLSACCVVNSQFIITHHQVGGPLPGFLRRAALRKHLEHVVEEALLGIADHPCFWHRALPSNVLSNKQSWKLKFNDKRPVFL